MKKNKKIILIICVLLVICSFVGFLIYYNATAKQYKEYQYLQIDGYHNAKTNSIKKGRITLYLETSLSLSKQKEMQLFDVLEQDYQTLESALNLKSDVKVAIISDEYILSSNNGFLYHDGIVLCNSGAFENGKYKTALTGAYMKTTETWKQVAATHYYFNDGTSVDISKLKDHYAQNEDDLLLTLFQGYFNASFASNEVIDIADMTAVSLGGFIIDNYSFDDFLNASLTDYRREWLSQNDINTSFDVPFDLSWLSGAVYSEKLLQYPLVIETKNRVYYLDSFHAERNSATFDHPRAVIEHLSNGNAGVNKVLEYIKSNATKNTSDTILKNADAKIEYYISSDEIGTEADVNNKKVYLKDPSEFVHETAHILTMNNNRVDGAWLAEGVAEYLSREISGVNSDIDYRMYHSFVASDVTGDLKSFVEDVKTQYKNSGGSFESFEAFDFYLLEQSIAYVTLTKPEYKQKIKFPYATTSVKDLRYSSSGDKGNNLTYPESYLFVRYLINKYGLDNVLNCCLVYGLEQSFNETYDVIYSNFIKAIQYYRKHYSMLSVNPEQIAWQLDDSDKDMLPIMQSDIMLRKGNHVFIIDAKYYLHNTQEQYGAHTLHSANLYQIFTYVKNKEYELKDTEHKVSGMLLYAKTDDTIQPDNSYIMSGNRISVKTLDLNVPFEKIKEQLDSIVKHEFEL